MEKIFHLRQQDNLTVKVLFDGLKDIPQSNRLDNLCWNFSEAFLEQVRLEEKESCQKANEARVKTIVNLLDCFPYKYQYQTIPNEYCSKSCCYERPWLRVMTPKGPIKIGWRKRVINIDWAEFFPKQTGREQVIFKEKDSLSPEIFKDENVTYGPYYVHAWGYEKAKEYLATLLK